MKKNVLNIGLFSLAVAFFASCSSEDDIIPAVPDASAARQLVFYSAEPETRASWNDDIGSGSLIFQWDYTDDDARHDEMVFSIYNPEFKPKDEDALHLPEGFVETESTDIYHTYVEIWKPGNNSNDSHFATFMTCERYGATDKQLEGNTLFAVSPLSIENNYELTATRNEFKATLKMPNSFEQVESKKPNFLRDYMYMYGYATISNGTASINFKHIPATFRLIINNKSGDEIYDLSKVTISTSDGTMLGAQSVELEANTTKGDFDITTSARDNLYYSSVTTNIREPIEKGGQYTAYAMVLPIEGLTIPEIKFTLTINGEDYEAKVVTNRSLQSGYSYTVTLNYEVGLTVGSVTVEKWGEGNSMDEGIATPMEATSTIDGNVATISASKYVSSFTEAVQAAMNADCETIIVNGALSSQQQTALATALANYTGVLILDGTKAANVSNALKNIVDVTMNNGTYEVYNATGLLAWNEAVQNDLTLNLTLIADITLPTEGITITDGVPSGSNWIVVGDRNNPYTGMIDGNGKTIKGLVIKEERDYVGFVGYIYGGTIKDLTLDEVVVYNTRMQTGAFAGTIDNGCTISGCTVSGSVISTAGIVGGIVGWTTNNSSAQHNKIVDCTNHAIVEGTDHIGGITSIAKYTDFMNCRNTGDVTGTAMVGGIVASIGSGSSAVKIMACVNEETATVTGISAGGIVGFNAPNSFGSVVACANVGNVNDGAGLIDDNRSSVIGCYTTCSKAVTQNSGTFDACYYVGEDDEIDGTKDVEGVEDLNTDEVVNTMNTAIETWNTSNNNACEYKWKVGTTYPELTLPIAAE